MFQRPLTSFVFSSSTKELFGSVRAPVARPARILRHYATKKGPKRKKVQTVGFDSDVAESVVNIEKISSIMETEVDKFRHELRSTITTSISPAMFDNIKLLTRNGKPNIRLGTVASIASKNDKYVLDLSSSPNLTSLVMKTLNENKIFSPLLEGNTITVSVPRLTMDVRETLLKTAKVVCEEAKVGIRKARQKGMSDVRKQKKGMSQDDARMVEGYIQSLTDNYVKQVDDLLQEKSKELLQR